MLAVHDAVCSWEGVWEEVWLRLWLRVCFWLRVDVRGVRLREALDDGVLELLVEAVDGTV